MGYRFKFILANFFPRDSSCELVFPGLDASLQRRYICMVYMYVCIILTVCGPSISQALKRKVQPPLLSKLASVEFDNKTNFVCTCVYTYLSFLLLFDCQLTKQLWCLIEDGVERERDWFLWYASAFLFSNILPFAHLLHFYWRSQPVGGGLWEVGDVRYNVHCWRVAIRKTICT